MHVPVLVLGGGISGIAASHFLGHKQVMVLEREARLFGHCAAEVGDGFTWDTGPHVSFTRHEFVRRLIDEHCSGPLLDFPVTVANFFRGTKIAHPAQCNLYQLPQPERNDCLNGFLQECEQGGDRPLRHYGDWLDRAFGSPFADLLPKAYTRKYWTVDASRLTTDWVGERVFRPEREQVLRGAEGPLPFGTHYIQNVRYPARGGFQELYRKLCVGMNARVEAVVVRVNLAEKCVHVAGGESIHYQILVNTLPLPEFIRLCDPPPGSVTEAVEALSASRLLLVNVRTPNQSPHPEHWLYVYDEDCLSTRLYCTERLSPNNAPRGHSGIQVEVYASKFRGFPGSFDEIGCRVVSELAGWGFVVDPELAAFETRLAPYANVIFDQQRRSAMSAIFDWLETFGFVPDEDALEPAVSWTKEPVPSKTSSLYLAGRFGQWKYLWTDDCILRGRQLAQVILPVLRTSTRQ